MLMLHVRVPAATAAWHPVESPSASTTHRKHASRHRNAVQYRFVARSGKARHGNFNRTKKFSHVHSPDLTRMFNGASPRGRIFSASCVHRSIADVGGRWRFSSRNSKYGLSALMYRVNFLCHKMPALPQAPAHSIHEDTSL